MWVALRQCWQPGRQSWRHKRMMTPPAIWKDFTPEGTLELVLETAQRKSILDIQVKDEGGILHRETLSCADDVFNFHKEEKAEIAGLEQGQNKRKNQSHSLNLSLLGQTAPALSHGFLSEVRQGFSAGHNHCRPPFLYPSTSPHPVRGLARICGETHTGSHGFMTPIPAQLCLKNKPSPPGLF